MKKANVQAVYDWLDSVAPFASQEEYDNAGIQTGDPGQEVSRVLVTLDVTKEVVREAQSLGAELILSHHPILFSPISSMNEKEYVPGILASLIRSGISLISAHTNADKSEEFSASIAVARLLSLMNVRKEGKYLFIGELDRPAPAGEVQEMISVRLKGPAFLFGDPGQYIRTLAVAGGAYSEGWREAMDAGAQALLTGEVRHHHAVEAVSRGLVLYEGGHYATEAPMLAPLAAGLQNAMDKLNYSLRVDVSRCIPYALG